MSPRTTMLNIANSSGASMFCKCDCVNGHLTIRDHLANITHILFGQLRAIVVYAASRALWLRMAAISLSGRSASGLILVREFLQSKPQSVQVVVSASNPFQILKAIIRFIAVNVVALWSFRVFATKGEQYQTMHSPLSALAALVETHKRVSTAINDLFQNDSGRVVALWVKRPYLAGIRRFIPVFMTGDRLPSRLVHSGSIT